jgi:hypothetical protein
MGWIERIIRALIYLCFIALGFYLILWVLAAIGLALPGMVITILKVILILVAILILIRLLVPSGNGWWNGPWFPGPPNPPA